MAERFELVEKALIRMLEDKKYATLRDILITVNPSDIAGIFSGLEEKQIPLCSVCCPRSWRQKLLWKWKVKPRSC